MQGQTITYVAQDLRAALIGMGPSTSQFYECVGRKTEDLLLHPHSEVVEVLWQGGLPGLLLYLAMMGGLFFSIATPRTSRFHPQSLAGQAILIAGMISGLAVGNIMITTPRLATFGLLMAFVYGRLIRDARIARAEEARRSAAPEEVEPCNIIPLHAPGLGHVAGIESRSR